MKITHITAREILDSRGNPTLEAELFTDYGISGTASVPSGASTGEGEAFELRDGDKSRYRGLGVLKAVSNVTNVISPLLSGLDVSDQIKIDKMMIEKDGTPDKRNLGANAILAVSLAAAQAAAKAFAMPLYRYIGGVSSRTLPVPMMNILNGGAHADNSLDIQEFMILPVGADNIKNAVRMGAEVFFSLRSVIKKGGGITSVGDEGGFAPMLKSASEALDLICEGIKKAGYTPGRDVLISLDAAASEWYDGEKYVLPKSGEVFTSDSLSDFFYSLAKSYPIYSIEDPMAESDWEGWQKMTARFRGVCRLVGDDLFVTNPDLIKKGIEKGAADTVLIKPNQIGTLTETLEAVKTAHNASLKTILSHRSGETEDTSIADIAVATECGHIKTGAPSRCDRTAKYNRLMKIESDLGSSASFYRINQAH